MRTEHAVTCVNVLYLNYKSGSKHGSMHQRCPWMHTSLIPRFMVPSAPSLRGTHLLSEICCHQSQCNITRTFSFLWHLLFDKLKLIDMVEQFITFTEHMLYLLCFFWLFQSTIITAMSKLTQNMDSCFTLNVIFDTTWLNLYPHYCKTVSPRSHNGLKHVLFLPIFIRTCS